MSSSDKITECAKCGASVDLSNDTVDGRTPCNECGSTIRIHNAFILGTAVARDGIGIQARRPGEKRPYIEDRSFPEYWRDGQKFVQRSRVIDRDNYRYFEEVTDYESGEAMHRCEEPLRDHRGHGSAAPKMPG